MSVLWTSEETAKATGGKAQGKAWEATGVSIDSRTVQPGDLFVALSGERFDGHAYVKGALEKGAAAALVSRIPEGMEKDAPLLVVSDPMQGLIDLGKASRGRSSAKIAAVTGSVGKTSTRAMLQEALKVAGAMHASIGNLNNHIGVPLSLARMPRDVNFAVFELGMNHAGEITPLSEMVNPHVSIITTIAPVHLEFFDSVEGIARAKAEIFTGMQRDSVALLPADNPHYALLAALADVAGVASWPFGEQDSASIRLLSHQQQGEEAILTVRLGEVEIKYTLAHPGRHMAVNSLAALGAAWALGVAPEKAIQGLETWRPEDGRGARREMVLGTKKVMLIDDSYNASPPSMRAAIQGLARETSRRVAVLGDMLELGPNGPKLHATLAEDIAEAGIEAVFTAGPLMHYLHERLPNGITARHWDYSAALLRDLPELLIEGDAVLIKGSHGSGMYKVAAAFVGRKKQDAV